MEACFLHERSPLLRRQFPWEEGYNEDKPWLLHEKLRFYSRHLDRVVEVPADFRTDFATVPWVFRRVFPQDGPYSYAAVVHDWLCVERDGHSSVDAAVVFREAMEALSVPLWTSVPMYWGVLHFGPHW